VTFDRLLAWLQTGLPQLSTLSLATDICRSSGHRSVVNTRTLCTRVQSSAVCTMQVHIYTCAACNDLWSIGVWSFMLYTVPPYTLSTGGWSLDTHRTSRPWWCYTLSFVGLSVVICCRSRLSRDRWFEWLDTLVQLVKCTLYMEYLCRLFTIVIIVVTLL